MSTSVNNFMTFQAYAEYLLMPEMPINEETTEFAKTTLSALKKCVEDITDASVRPDVSKGTKEMAETLLGTVENVRKATIPMLRNKFSLGLSPGAELGIRLGSFLAVMGVQRYTPIFDEIGRAHV